MAAKKANPERTCVGCRGRFPQRDLVRFVRGANGWFADAPGRLGKQPGRGAYLCSTSCAQRATKNKRYPGLGTTAVECGLIESSCKRMNDVA